MSVSRALGSAPDERSLRSEDRLTTRSSGRPWASTMRGALARESEPRLGEVSGAGDIVGGEENAVLARIQAGDASAFASTVERHLPHLLSVARRMLRDDAEAEDVAQEALIRLWRNAGRLQVGPGGLRPWLRRVVSNLCIDRVRASRHLAVVDEVPEQVQPASQLCALGEQELAQRVDQALQRLPERQRLALVLFHYEGLSQIEVAKILDVSDEAVESLLSRARRALKGTLRADWQHYLPEEGAT